MQLKQYTTPSLEEDNHILMAPRPITWEVLTFFEEDFDQETGAFRHTTFAVIDEDGTAYFGTLNHRKRDITLEQLLSALAPISDHDFFPEWSPWNEKLTRALDALPPNIYVKRPDLALYGVFQEHNALRLIPEGLFEEAKAMEMLSQHPHPNIIYYHGCRVRRGRITGLILERHPYTLTDYLKNKVKSVDKEPFMKALESAIRHLHSRLGPQRPQSRQRPSQQSRYANPNRLRVRT
ncbi:kinase-like domain [Pyrenophora seminiperda CCB06]|uniref:Kinase-like domain n=1 Tax=Pyrenophora seminiperda CCB06 TaxID=1302712 RepID=A0A3M7MIF8_9PLEO|nr:kinase-like domain [Pyrenophora seminiperda CCB06]